MTSVQDHNQSTGSNDNLIGTLVYHISVISSLVGREKLRRETESFETSDWNSVLKSLGIHDVVGENNARDYVVTLIGQHYRCCPEPQRIPFIRALTDIFFPSIPSTPSTPSVTLETQAHSEQQQNTDNSIPLHRYTSFLHEKAQRENGSFQRIAEEQVTLDPPLFKVTVRYGNRTCFGQGRNKKEAGHKASKLMFEQLRETL